MPANGRRLSCVICLNQSNGYFIYIVFVVGWLGLVGGLYVDANFRLLCGRY